MSYNDNNYGGESGSRNVWSSGSRGGKIFLNKEKKSIKFIQVHVVVILVQVMITMIAVHEERKFHHKKIYFPTN